MSRTDKDRPYRVRATDPLEPGRYVWHLHRPCCDLTDEVPSTARDHWSRSCTWQIDGWAYSPYAHSKPVDRRVYGWAPERQREREELRALAREYNAHGELEDGDFANFQTRHGVDWLVS